MWAHSPPREEGGCAIKKCREATEAWRRRGGSLAKPCKQELWNHPACSAFLEFDGLAGTPPNLGGEFQTRNCQLAHLLTRGYILLPLRGSNRMRFARHFGQHWS